MVFSIDDEVLSVGLININELNELTTTTKLREILDLAMSKSIPPHDKYPTIGPKTKLFELDDCKGRGKVRKNI